MFNHLKEQIEHQKEKSLADCDKASEKLSLLEEDLKKRQEEERHLATVAREQERQVTLNEVGRENVNDIDLWQAAEVERERATREAALVVEQMEARVAEVQDDVKQRQLQVDNDKAKDKKSAKTITKTEVKLLKHMIWNYRASGKRKRWQHGWRR